MMVFNVFFYEFTSSFDVLLRRIEREVKYLVGSGSGMSWVWKMCWI